MQEIEFIYSEPDLIVEQQNFYTNDLMSLLDRRRFLLKNSQTIVSNTLLVVELERLAVENRRFVMRKATRQLLKREEKLTRILIDCGRRWR
jgi:hypothetical protein